MTQFNFKKTLLKVKYLYYMIYFTLKSSAASPSYLKKKEFGKISKNKLAGMVGKWVKKMQRYKTKL